jgi:hypothetical protein
VLNPSLREVLRHRKEYCEDCGIDGILVDTITCDGDGVVVVRLPSGGGLDLIVAAVPGRGMLTIGSDGSDPLCKRCARKRTEASVTAYLEGNDL